MTTKKTTKVVKKTTAKKDCFMAIGVAALSDLGFYDQELGNEVGHATVFKTAAELEKTLRRDYELGDEHGDYVIVKVVKVIGLREDVIEKDFMKCVKELEDIS